MPGIDLGTLCMRGKCSTPELYLQPLQTICFTACLPKAAALSPFPQPTFPYHADCRHFGSWPTLSTPTLYCCPFAVVSNDEDRFLAAAGGGGSHTSGVSALWYAHPAWSTNPSTSAGSLLGEPALQGSPRPSELCLMVLVDRRQSRTKIPMTLLTQP